MGEKLIYHTWTRDGQSPKNKFPSRINGTGSLFLHGVLGKNMPGILCDRPDAWMGWEHLQPISILFQARIWRGNKPYMEHLGRDSLRAFACNLRRELTFFTWPLPITFEHYILRIGFTTELLIPLTCWMLLRIIPIDAECFDACLNLVTVRKQSSLFYEGTSTNLQYPLVL